MYLDPFSPPDEQIACLSNEIISLRKRLDEQSKRHSELSCALCDMLFVFTCFEEKGIKEYPEEMQEKLKEYFHKAKEAFVGHELPPLQPITLNDLYSRTV